MKTFEEKLAMIEKALNNRTAKFAVHLSNVGNPDFRQDPRRKLPDTTVGWGHVDTLRECVELCLAYISFYDLGGGNWNGGKIVEDGKFIGRVAYNGRCFDVEHWTPTAKEICVS